MTTFQALVIDKVEDQVAVSIKSIHLDNLPKDEVLIKVNYSSVNYKDGLASVPEGNIVKAYPFIPGIDLAGTVQSSRNPRFQPGDEVIVTSYELGVTHFGGYSEYACVPSEWVVPLPKGLTLKQAMICGTAGFTAALSIVRLEENGVKPEDGPILVTGATGGVGSMAVAMLTKRGFQVVASTGKETEHAYLIKLGAIEVISREKVAPEKIRALDKQRWAGVVDPVGGKTLSYALTSTKYGGSVAVSGLTGGPKMEATVFPFILRGINLLGIDSVYCKMDKRHQVWDRIATDLHIGDLYNEVATEINLTQLPDVLSTILNGNVRGRTVVKVARTM
jgi:acrylyl-CoA reductase (NADPH)